MGRTGQSGKKGLENLSVNSSRRTGTREDVAGNPAHGGNQRGSTSNARVPDQQIPSEPSSPSQETTVHPDAGAADLPKTG